MHQTSHVTHLFQFIQKFPKRALRLAQILKYVINLEKHTFQRQKETHKRDKRKFTRRGTVRKKWEI